MRLKIAQFCAKNGICSKKDAKKFIELGQLKLKGKIVRYNTLVESTLSAECVTVPTRAQSVAANKVSVILHKPESCLSTFSRRAELWAKSLLVPENRCDNDAKNRLNPSRLRRLVPINPLEYAASGLVLFSEDASLTSRFAECEETYHVAFKDPITEPKLFVLTGEVHIDGVAIPRLKVKQLSQHAAHVTIQGASGKLRKACRLAGLDVRSLKRIQMGNVQLGDLLYGRWMLMRRYQLT
ncbi:pseudouridylate synthase [Babesia caballi]|uniref:Pseudouridylate synthase n=1 Tax=Babesia caballi TaxID=5871 RepID=A0AAV4LWS4_BABCB|nr:pseudouridylate synthase [Babesia caballi]